MFEVKYFIDGDIENTKTFDNRGDAWGYAENKAMDMFRMSGEDCELYRQHDGMCDIVLTAIVTNGDEETTYEWYVEYVEEES